MSDGGPGFVDAVGPGNAHTVNLEAATFVGLERGRDPWNASTHELGLAVRGAIETGAHRVVVGLGGTRTNDGGAGFLAALGATADVPLDRGPAGLRGITKVDLAPARALVGGVDLVAAADVDIPLLGLFGATKTFGEQKGLAEDELLEVDRLLAEFTEAAGLRRTADDKGAGAAGGLGFAFLALGERVVRGVEYVADALGLADACGAHDLVVTGEGTFDHTSRSGKVVWGVAHAAQEVARPCIALAGQVTVGQREMRAMGIESAYSMTELSGSERSFGDPAGALADLAERVARTWSSAV